MTPYHRLPLLLKAAGLSRSTFYYQASVLSAADKSASLKETINTIFNQHKGCYGYRRLTAQLRTMGHLINRKAVQRLMQQLGLKSLVRPKKYRAWRGDEAKAKAPNLLARQFEAEKPHEKWVTDITEFKVKGNKLYLSPIMDLYNGEIVAYEIQKRSCFEMVQNMLEKALKRLKKGQKPLLHSDQGWHYHMPKWQLKLRKREVKQSMSRKGNCLDNAAMESFFAVLKTECFYMRKWDSIEQLQHALHDYIHYYNHERIKLKLGGQSPVQFRLALNP